MYKVLLSFTATSLNSLFWYHQKRANVPDLPGVISITEPLPETALTLGRARQVNNAVWRRGSLRHACLPWSPTPRRPLGLETPWAIGTTAWAFLLHPLSRGTVRLDPADEISPGAAIQGDPALVEYIRDQSILSFMHPCCTAAMLPKSNGGVVGPDLKVHGLEGLRVVDMSVKPSLPGTHRSATAYTVGEKAADIIIKQWSNGR
ncbi:GMC oxidoreductase-domain-containing protein [Schizothecium vesticola]|uniref:GMC oxidoreductase-domain-containing protein n=1 Tax=Schizothecium vesticola TaxID=314040 RepID=A0AA40BQ20_9PEZI|nr:GMC oxidoreductase-domain-containing protein [Schizothecium vesticola]